MPILPYVFGVEDGVAVISAVLSGGALLVVGGLLAWTSERSPLWGAMRMLLVGGLAASVTFGVGRLIGVTLSG